MKFDSEDYAAIPDNLPDSSVIKQALSYGAVFECKDCLWLARHPMYVSEGKTQLEAAKAFMRYAETRKK